MVAQEDLNKNINKMEDTKKVKVKTTNLPQSALKLRLVANMVRNMNAKEAQDLLRFVNKKGALYVKKTLDSAIKAAEERFDVTSDGLKVTHISVDEAPTFKRVRFASRGRVSTINKRRSNLNLEVSLIK